MVLGVLSFASCSSGPRPLPPPEVVIEPSWIVGDFLARQRLIGRFGSQEVRFEAALQKKGDTLTVVGLTPFGTKAFTLVQEAKQVRFEDHLPPGRSVPLRPNYLLADIHHAFFALPDPKGTAVGGWRPALHGEEYVYEEEQEGGLLRVFRLGLGRDERRVEVLQRGKIGALPRRVSLDNGYYGYALEIETVSYQALE